MSGNNTNNSWNTPYLTSDGQLLIGSSTGRPVAAFLSSSSQTLSIVSGPGSINLDIAAALSVPFGGTGRTGLTSYGVLLGEGSNSVNVTAAGTDGQLLIGSTTGDPAFSTITSAGGTLTFSFGPNSLNIEVNSEGFTFVTPWTVPLGGTGRTLLTTYGVLIGEGSDNVNVTAAGTDGQVLLSSSTGDPAFGTITSPLGSLTLTPGPNSLGVDLTVPVTVEFGGTGHTILTTYGVLIGEGSNNVNVTAAGTDGQVLIGSTTGDPSFSTITSVGGTITFSYGPNSLNIEVTADIDFAYVQDGGTGRTVLTTYGVMLGEGSNNVNVTAAGTDGQVLLGSSTGDPAFGTITSPLGSLTLTPGTNSLAIDLTVPVTVEFGGTGQTILTTYGVLIGEGSNNVNVTAAGTDGQLLIASTTGDPAFSTMTSAGGTLTFSFGPNSINVEVNTSGFTFVTPWTVPLGGTGRTTLTNYGVLLGEGSNNVNVTAAGTDGQVLLGSSTGDPAFGTITSPLGSLTLTPGINSLAIDLTVPVTVEFGGTGQTILTTYGVLIGEGSNNVNVTAAGTDGQLLVASTTGDPAFSTMTSAGGTLTFSFGPNSINVEVNVDGFTFVTPWTVPLGGTGRTTLTNYGVLIGEGSNNVNVTAAGTDGQVLIGSSTGDPAFSTITSVGGTITFSYGPNSLNIEVTADVDFAYVQDGGTGRTVLTTYGVLLGEGSNNVNVTAAGTDGQVLLGSSTGDPAFGTITSPLGSLTLTPGTNSLAIDLTVPVTVEFGGTGHTILTTYGVLIGEGSNNVNVTAAGTDGQLLIASTTGDPAFSTITSAGGTLTFSFGPNSINVEVNADGFTFTTPWTVPLGGTGRTTLTTYGVLLGEGSNNVNVTAAGTDGQILLGSSAGDPAFGSITSPLGTLTFGVGANSLTADLVVPVIVGFGGTGQTILTMHGVLLGEGTNDVNVTAAGTDGQVLIGGTSLDPVFTTLASSSGSIQFSPGPNSLSIDVVGGGLPWIYTTTSTYFTNNTGLIVNSSTPSVAVLTLPATAPQGSVIRVSGMGTGGWQIATSPTTAGQVINFGDMASVSSTPLASTQIGDAVELLCVTADQTWFVLSAQGNLTII